jgi:hypothetical protein
MFDEFDEGMDIDDPLFDSDDDDFDDVDDEDEED